MIVEELLSTLGIQVNLAEFAEAEGALGKLKTAIGAVAVAMGLNVVKEMVNSVTEMAVSAQHASQKLGITSEAVQELNYAARVNEVPGFERSLMRLERALDQVATKGKGPAADAMRKLGITAKELKGEKIDANLELIADRFAKLPDGQQKAAIAMQLFGRSGAQMIPLLNSGSDGIKKLRSEAEQLGTVVGNTEKFEEFKREQIRVSEVWKGIKIQIVSELLPALHEMVTGMFEWIKANRDMLGVAIQAAITALSVAFHVLWAAISIVVSVGRELATFWNQHRILAMAFVGVIVGLMLPAIWAWISANAVLIAELAVINAPIAAIVAAVAAVILIINHWRQIWDTIGPAATRAVNTVLGGLKAAWGWISDHLLSGHLSQTISDAISDAFHSLGQKIIEAISEAFDWIRTEAKKVASEVWAEIKKIPVIGALARGGERAVDYIRGDSGSSSTSGAQQASPLSPDQVQRMLYQPMQWTPESVGPGSGGAGPLTATFASPNITIQAGVGMDEAKLAELTASHVEKAQRTMIEDAYESWRLGSR